MFSLFSSLDKTYLENNKLHCDMTKSENESEISEQPCLILNHGSQYSPFFNSLDKTNLENKNLHCDMTKSENENDRT